MTNINITSDTTRTPQLELITDRKEVGQVWVMQAKRNKGAPGEGTEGHSVLGVLINDVSYLGFRITNDISDEAADYRLFCVDESGVLQSKGLVWKITAKVDKKNERPVTTLYIRIDTAESKAETETDFANPLTPLLRVPEEYFYYVANQKKVVAKAVPGKGMLHSKHPSFGIYKRRFTAQSAGSDTETSSSEVGGVEAATVSNKRGISDSVKSANDDAVQSSESSCQKPETKKNGIFGVDEDNVGNKILGNIFGKQLNR
ncbi:MAG: hypothetical protein JZU65_12385 [Chlorobium sp.]|nr:hypothetical protein [Chlorobium sp.]